MMAGAIVVSLMALNSCSNEDNYFTEAVSISGPGVNHHAATIELNETLQLRANNGIMVKGEGFVWESSNPEVATVDQNGLVKAVGLGETVIKVTTTGNDVIYNGEIVVYVLANSIGIINEEIDQSEAE